MNRNRQRGYKNPVGGRATLHPAYDQVDLQFADVLRRSVEQAVEIMLFNPVGINQRDLRDSNPRNAFRHDATDTAKPDYADFQVRDHILRFMPPCVESTFENLFAQRCFRNTVVKVNLVRTRPDNADFPAPVMTHPPSVSFPEPHAPATVRADGQTQQRQARRSRRPSQNITLRFYVSQAHFLPSGTRMTVHES